MRFEQVMQRDTPNTPCIANISQYKDTRLLRYSPMWIGEAEQHANALAEEAFLTIKWARCLQQLLVPHCYVIEAIAHAGTQSL